MNATMVRAEDDVDVGLGAGEHHHLRHVPHTDRHQGDVAVERMDIVILRPSLAMAGSGA